MQIVLTLLVILVMVTCVFFYMKKRLRTMEDNKNLKAEIDLEVTKMTKGDPKEAIMVGVYKNGTSYFKSEGRFSDDLYQLPDPHSVFQVGSLSKLFTAAILNSLVDDGVVSMDATLSELIGVKHKLHESAQSVTLRQLVTHTSGFPRVPQALFDLTVEHFGKGNVLENPYSVLRFKDIAKYLKHCEGKKAPGQFEYSNFGSGLLGHVLEIVTGKTLDVLAKEILFTPLSMSTTSIKLDSEMRESMVQGHTHETEKAGLWTFGALAGAGGFNSTAADMLTFLKSYLEQGNDVTAPLNADGGWLSAGKLEKLYGNDSVVWHNGKVGGYASYAAVDPINDAAVIVLSAKAGDLTMPGIMLARLARTQSWGSETSS